LHEYKKEIVKKALEEAIGFKEELAKKQESLPFREIIREKRES
jgi:hypothetical protein